MLDESYLFDRGVMVFGWMLGDIVVFVSFCLKLCLMILSVVSVIWGLIVWDFNKKIRLIVSLILLEVLFSGIDGVDIYVFFFWVVICFLIFIFVLW